MILALEANLAFYSMKDFDKESFFKSSEVNHLYSTFEVRSFKILQMVMNILEYFLQLKGIFPSLKIHPIDDLIEY